MSVTVILILSEAGKYGTSIIHTQCTCPLKDRACSFYCGILSQVRGLHEGSDQDLLTQSVYHTHMHTHCRYPDVRVLSENMCLGTPTMGFPFTCQQKETWLVNNVQLKLIHLYGCVTIRVV